MLYPKRVPAEDVVESVEASRLVKGQVADLECGVKSLALVGGLALALRGGRCHFIDGFQS